MKAFKEQIYDELKNHILPFWLNLQDLKYGGHYGAVDFDLNTDEKAPKGAIAMTRYLWTFASAYRVFGDEAYLECAKQTYQFIVSHLLDASNGGLLWMVDYAGNLIDARKHIYAQAFGIYALSEYYRASGDVSALKNAIVLYRLVEEKGYNPTNNAYREEFTKDWTETNNEMLSENGIIAKITFNTHLHILEAYTNLYRAWTDVNLKERIENLIKVFYHKIYDANTGFFKVFFNEQWEEIIDLKSYGHDIEASWLIDEALKACHIKDECYADWIVQVTDNIRKNAILSDGSVMNECEKGIHDKTKIWWVHAEALMGLYNAYEHTGNESTLEAMHQVWAFISSYFVDQRAKGEWFYALDDNNKQIKRAVVEPWKCSYHNSRVFLEIIERMEKE